ncbi:hypothetical protein D3C80_1588730 [compost metagenome]
MLSQRIVYVVLNPSLATLEETAVIPCVTVDTLIESLVLKRFIKRLVRLLILFYQQAWIALATVLAYHPTNAIAQLDIPMCIAALQYVSD